jgi:hypothetical protein
MKKTAAGFYILILLLTGILQFPSLARANPYLYQLDKEEVAPPPDVSPPTINIRNPENNTASFADNVTLSFWLSYDIPLLPELFYYSLSLSDVYYEASWIDNKTSLDITPVTGSIHTERFFSEENAQKWNTYWVIKPYTVFHRFSVSLEEVPAGSHWLKVTAILVGSRETVGSSPSWYPTIHYALYKIAGSSTVTFAVGNVSILSPQNKTYENSDVPLLFEAPESAKDLAYSLDGQKNVTVAGNTTLTDLSGGAHNVTVNARDAAGNVRVSETIIFTITKEQEQNPFPTTFTAGSLVLAVAIGAGLLVYFKKRPEETRP